MHRNEPGRLTLAHAGASHASAVISLEQSPVPAAEYLFAIWREVVIELVGKREAAVGAAIDIAEDLVPLAHHKAMEAAVADLQDEVARATVSDQL